MNCQFTQNEDMTWKCSRCGYITRSKSRSKPLKHCKKPGLGDLLKKFLSFFWLTPKRFEWLRGKRRIQGGFVCYYVDIPEEEQGCGCQKRQEALNEFGKQIGF